MSNKKQIEQCSCTWEREYSSKNFPLMREWVLFKTLQKMTLNLRR